MRLQVWYWEQPYSPKSCPFRVLLTLKFFRSTVVFGNSCFQEDLFEASRFCKDIFFQNTTSSRPFCKVVCYFIYLSFIFFFDFSKKSSLSCPLHHLGWFFFYQSGCSHLFFHGLYRTDNFWQLLLIKTKMAMIHSLKCTVSFSFIVLLLSLALSHCYLLSLVVTRCITRCHSFSLDVPLVVIRCHSMYHSSVFL